MTKGMYYYIRQAWKKPSSVELRKKMVEWRKSDAITRIEKPSRLDRARGLGYKAKQGFTVVRVRLARGGRTRPRMMGGRRSKRRGRRKILQVNYQWVAEQRAAKRYKGLEVLNSYWLGKEGIHYFYEVILVDPNHPQILADPTMKWISTPANRGRALRALTSAGKRFRQ